MLAGLILAYAIAFKVTPGLFLLYFAYKRSWRTVGATALGMGLFLLVVPSLFLGLEFNGVCLGTWWNRILSPYVDNDFVSPQEMNQSLVGVLTRLLTETKGGEGRYAVQQHVNFVALDHKTRRQGAQGALDRPGRPPGLALPDEVRAARRPSPARRVLLWSS